VRAADAPQPEALADAAQEVADAALTEPPSVEAGPTPASEARRAASVSSAPSAPSAAAPPAAGGLSVAVERFGPHGVAAPEGPPAAAPPSERAPSPASAGSPPAIAAEGGDPAVRAEGSQPATAATAAGPAKNAPAGSDEVTADAPGEDAPSEPARAEPGVADDAAVDAASAASEERERAAAGPRSTPAPSQPPPPPTAAPDAPDAAQASPEDAEVRRPPNAPQASPDAAQASPDAAQASPEDAEVRRPPDAPAPSTEGAASPAATIGADAAAAAPAPPPDPTPEEPPVATVALRAARADAWAALFAGGDPATAETVDALDVGVAEADIEASERAPEAEGWGRSTDTEPVPWKADEGKAGAASSSPGSAQTVLRQTVREAPSVSARETAQGRYIAAVERQVVEAWYNVEIDPRAALFGTDREVTVLFYVHRNGRVDPPTIVTSSGEPALDAASISAVPRRLPPFPADVTGEGFFHKMTLRYRRGRPATAPGG
jgi:TonB family protein